MKKKSYLIILMSIISLPLFATENVVQDNDQLLLTSCQTLTAAPENKDAKHCFHFIQGFLAAAQALDPLIVKKKNEKSLRPQTFMSRSYSQPMSYYRTKPSLLFCIPNNESEASIINVIAKQLPSQKYTKKMLGDMILTTLKTNYPCEKN